MEGAGIVDFIRRMHHRRNDTRDQIGKRDRDCDERDRHRNYGRRLSNEAARGFFERHEASTSGNEIRAANLK